LIRACRPMGRVQPERSAQGVRVSSLIAYSPDRNPIEPAWAKVKVELRRVAARTLDALHEALGQELCRVVRRRRGWGPPVRTAMTPAGVAMRRHR
jgi:hypothetical protein